jgi:hypothetical protein
MQSIIENIINYIDYIYDCFVNHLYNQLYIHNPLYERFLSLCLLIDKYHNIIHMFLLLFMFYKSVKLTFSKMYILDAISIYYTMYICHKLYIDNKELILGVINILSYNLRIPQYYVGLCA